jgi:hypothetical protein
MHTEYCEHFKLLLYDLVIYITTFVCSFMQHASMLAKSHSVSCSFMCLFGCPQHASMLARFILLLEQSPNLSQVPIRGDDPVAGVHSAKMQDPRMKAGSS